MTQQTKCSIRQVAHRLKEQYGDRIHHNRRNPLDELIFIICSVKRRERNYLESFAALKRHFPSAQALYAATQDEISNVLAPFGLQNEKAHSLKRILHDLCNSFGRPTLAPLKKMGDAQCEEYLMGLHGVGKKITRCVMLYSLDRQVFPVDSNCWRISQRLGLVDWTQAPTATCKDMDRLQDKVPASLRASLHKNMVSHGRTICRSRNPGCEACAVSEYCQHMAGASSSGRRKKGTRGI